MRAPQTLLLVVLASGCAPRVPGPPLGPHLGDTPIAVPYPPPVPHPMEIAPQPGEDMVWIDPHWAWTGGGYRWIAGGWMRPVPGAHYAPPSLVRLRNGQLMYYAGHWHGGGAEPEEKGDAATPAATP